MAEDQFGHDLKEEPVTKRIKSMKLPSKKPKKLPNFQVSLVREGAIFEKANATDACYDVKVFGREIKENYIKYYLGIKTNIPDGYQAKVYHRSSNSDGDGYIKNLVATIDARFPGEWQARVGINRQPTLTEAPDGLIYVTGEILSSIPLNVWENGEKALQVEFVKLLEHTVEFVSENKILTTVRDEKGHGSTGNGLLTDHILNR